ncbi:peptide chain release factor N(5)-glutamine methyltransferase [Pararhodonellum marinum]|uniref:peptide chain release factor N(5)-glutamine methyltransferase n=1 Tax=Pararhodonellum marinum TaxID=2755358 RepID=UPI00189057D9|nr:peptide chain release factor N(5)-glutamine methyltransferase [Pararhodonellum marinum]
MNARSLFEEYKIKLKDLYPEGEADALVLWLFSELLGVDKKDFAQNPVLPENTMEFEAAFKRLLEGEPIQYILGKAYFYGHLFKVDPSVLIPRGETEELVDMIIKENRESNLKILEIGTGSGCIPITLAKEMDKAQVFSMDVSLEALQIASQNAFFHQLPVIFYLRDVLRDSLPGTDLDIIVSNPPYVREMEKEAMHRNVINHEPELALFVPDDDPLKFYREIGKKANKALKPNGKLYFEINEALGAQLTEVLRLLGYQNIELLKDMHGKDRFCKAQRGT